MGSPSQREFGLRSARSGVRLTGEEACHLQVEAARSIAQRGVRLIATIHGDTLPEILNCRERGNLLGGQTSVTLSDGAAAQRADRRKTVQKRCVHSTPPPPPSPSSSLKERPFGSPHTLRGSRQRGVVACDGCDPHAPTNHGLRLSQPESPTFAQHSRPHRASSFFPSARARHAIAFT